MKSHATDHATRKSRWERVMPCAALVLVVAGCVPPPPAPPPTPQLPDLQGQTVRIGVVIDYPPFGLPGQDLNTSVGWDTDVFNELAKRLNFQSEYVITPFDALIDDVSAGELDVAGGGLTVTLERAEDVDYAALHVMVNQRVMLRADDDRVATIVELKQNAAMTIGVSRDTTNETAAVDYFGADRVVSFDTQLAATQALLDGVVDAMVVDDTAFKVALRLVPGQVRRLPGMVSGDIIGFVFTNGSALAAPFDQAFQTMVQDKTIQEINAKWGLR